MKKVLVLLILPLIISSGNMHSIKIVTSTPKSTTSPNPINNLVNALIYVESRGIDNAIGDKHLGKPSIGVLQIRPIMVQEVNRILKRIKSKTRYNLKDRFSRIKSIEMFMIWKNYHHKFSNYEKIARCWNGGPNGWKIPQTKKYWVKVKQQLNKIKN